MPGAFDGWRRNSRKNSSSSSCDPVGQRAAEVHQRVADGGHLPVEDADDPQSGRRREHQVVEAEVVVDQAAGDVAGLVLVEPGDDVATSRRCRRCAALAEPVGPAGRPGARRTLAPCRARPARPASTSTECSSTSTSTDVGAEGATSRSAVRLDAASSRRGMAPVDRVHHVERRSRSPTRRRSGPTISGTSGKTGASAGLDPVLAAHVVGALGLRAARRPAQDQVASG